jgi:hypothetical protein
MSAVACAGIRWATICLLDLSNMPRASRRGCEVSKDSDGGSPGPIDGSREENDWGVE